MFTLSKLRTLRTQRSTLNLLVQWGYLESGGLVTMTVDAKGDGASKKLSFNWTAALRAMSNVPPKLIAGVQFENGNKLQEPVFVLMIVFLAPGQRGPKANV